MSRDFESGLKLIARHMGRNPDGYLTDRFPVSFGTNKVDFSRTPIFADPIIATACVRVCTSDEEGTISHLTVFHSPELFVQDLYALLGRGVPTILNGGSDGSDASIQLYRRLRTELTKYGFVLGDPEDDEVLGDYSRVAILMRDRVKVTRRFQGDGPPEELEVFFPGKQNTIQGF